MLVAGKRFSYYKTFRRHDRFVLLCLRLEYELATDAAALSLSTVCLRRAANQLPVRHYAPFAFAQLRHCQCFSGEWQEVCGIVYDVNEADLVTLDSFEDGYRRELMPVYALGDGTQPLVVLIYVAEIETNVPRSNAEYKSLILEGARHWKLPATYLALLEAIQAAEDR